MHLTNLELRGPQQVIRRFDLSEKLRKKPIVLFAGARQYSRAAPANPAHREPNEAEH